MQETDLIQGLQTGHERAFEQLVMLHKNRLYNTVLGFLQNEAEAEDAVQEVFIKAFQNIKNFKGEAAISTWLYRIAVTHSLDVLRKKKRQKRGGFLTSLFSKKQEEWNVPDFHHPGIAAEKKEASAILFKAINQLPEAQQTAFILQKIESLGQTEIAEVMKISVGAVESLLQRAKAALRKLLEDYYQTHYK